MRKFWLKVILCVKKKIVAIFHDWVWFSVNFITMGVGLGADGAFYFSVISIAIQHISFTCPPKLRLLSLVMIFDDYNRTSCDMCKSRQNQGTVTRKMFPFDDVIMAIPADCPGDANS